MVDNLQVCTRCGYVVSDYRNAAWPAEQGPPSGFAPGPVTIAGNVTYAGEQPGATPCSRPDA